MRARHAGTAGLLALLLGTGAWAQRPPPTGAPLPPVTFEGTVVGYGTNALMVRDARGLVIPLGVDEDTRLEGARALEDLPVGQQVVVQAAPKQHGNLALVVRPGPAQGVGGGGPPVEAEGQKRTPEAGKLPILRGGRGADDIRTLGNDLSGTGLGKRGF